MRIPLDLSHPPHHRMKFSHAWHKFDNFFYKYHIESTFYQNCDTAFIQILAGVYPFRKTGFKTHQISIEEANFKQF